MGDFPNYNSFLFTPNLLLLLLSWLFFCFVFSSFSSFSSLVVKNFLYSFSPHNHTVQTRSSWLNCALRDDDAVYWVSIGHYEAVTVGD